MHSVFYYKNSQAPRRRKLERGWKGNYKIEELSNKQDVKPRSAVFGVFLKTEQGVA